MIKTEKDLNDILYIAKNLTLKENVLRGETKLQDEFMNSKNFNETFDFIEKRLNYLYVRTRIIHNIIDYSKEFLNSNIDEYTKYIYDLMDEITELKDSTQHNNGYISKKVEFYSKNEIILDRDNKSNIPQMSFYENKFIPSGKIIKNIKIKNINRTTTKLPYRENLNELMLNNIYRAFYIFDNPIKNGFKEEIEIELEKPEVINFIDIKTVNALITNVRYKDNNDTFYDYEFNNNVIVKEPISKIVFTLNSNIYKTEDINIDTDRKSTDVYSKINEELYNSQVLGKSLFDLEEYTGVKKYNDAYKKYLEQYKNWQEDYNNYIKQYYRWKSESRKKFKTGRDSYTEKYEEYIIDKEAYDEYKYNDLNIIAAGTDQGFDVDFEAAKQVLGKNKHFKFINAKKDGNAQDVINEDPEHSVTIGLQGATNQVAKSKYAIGGTNRFKTRVNLVESAYISGIDNVNNDICIIAGPGDRQTSYDTINRFKREHPALNVKVLEAESYNSEELKKVLTWNAGTLVLGGVTAKDGINIDVEKYGGIRIWGRDRFDTKKQLEEMFFS